MERPGWETHLRSRRPIDVEWGREVVRDRQRTKAAIRGLEQRGVRLSRHAEIGGLVERFAANPRGSYERAHAADRLADIIRPDIRAMLEVKLMVERDPRQATMLQNKLQSLDRMIERRKTRQNMDNAMEELLSIIEP